MDGVPGQVEFTFTLSSERHPAPDLVAARDYKVLADVEGLLVISVNGQIVFSEGGVLLLELGLDLSKWVEDTTPQCFRDFEYVSIDYDEGPLLRFTHSGAQRWRLESPWMRVEEDVLVDQAVLVASVERFVSRLEGQLRRSFGIELSSYSPTP